MNIFYGICGEGLGHALRSYAVIKMLNAEGFVVHVFTFGEAYNFYMNEKYPHLHKIEGLLLDHGNNKANLLGTARNFLRFFMNMKKNLRDIPDLAPKFCITDFEPLIPRIAGKLKLPCISIDNQHKFLCTARGLPFDLKLYSWAARFFIKWWIPLPRPYFQIVTTFHDFESTEKCIKANVIVRDEILRSTPTVGDYILVYVKKSMSEKVLDVLSKIDDKFIVYGLNPKEYSNMTFKEISNESFVRDLAGCKRLICTAGNQLVGEAKFLGKPLLVIPLKNQTEQMVNAWYVKSAGIGDYCSIDNFDERVVSNFLVKDYKISDKTNGLDKVMSALNDFVIRV